MPQNSVLSCYVSVAYGVGHVFNDLCSSMWFTYLLIFFNSVLKISNRLGGAALAIGQVADGIATQIVGFLSDKSTDHWLCRYGRRKTWHLIGSISVFCSFPFIFSPYYGFENLSEIGRFLYYCIFIIIFQFGWAAVQISHLSLVPDLTPHQQERTDLYTLRYAFTVSSNVIVYILLYARLDLEDEEKSFGPEDVDKFQWVAWMVTAIGFVTSLLFHVGVKEKHSSIDESDQTELLRNPLPSRSSLFYSLKFYNVALVYISSRLFINLCQVYLPYYLHKYLVLSAKKLAILPLVMFISSFVTSVAVPSLCKTFGKKITFSIGALIGIMACVWVYVGKVDDYYFKTVEIYGVVVAFGCASAIFLITSLGITSDLIGDNTHYGSLVYGFVSLGDKVSNGAAVLIVQNLEDVFLCPHYFKNVLIICCTGSAIFGTMSLLCLKSENQPEHFPEVHAEYETRDLDRSESEVAEEHSTPRM